MTTSRMLGLLKHRFALTKDSIKTAINYNSRHRLLDTSQKGGVWGFDSSVVGWRDKLNRVLTDLPSRIANLLFFYFHPSSFLALIPNKRHRILLLASEVYVTSVRTRRKY